MADPYGNYQANQGLLSGPALNPKGLDPELLRQITGLLSQTSPTPGLALPAGNMGYGVLQDAATAGKYAMGNPDRLTTDQIIPSVANSAMALGAGGMPMAEAGAAGIFGGKLTRDPAGFAKLGEGKDMLTAGVNPRDTYLETGAWNGPEGMMRYEIPDVDSVLNKPALKAINEATPMTAPLKDVLDHPELYKAYPELAEIPVTFNPSGTHTGSFTPPTGAFTPPNSSIMVSGNDPVQVHSVLLHEIQHAVQNKEGFTPGWSPEGATYLRNDLVRKADQTGMSSGKIKDFLVNFNPYDAYRRAAGEVEARAVQARAGLTPEQAAIFSPDLDMTAQVPRSKWIVRQPSGILGQR
jgi:hypothetical protein